MNVDEIREAVAKLVNFAADQGLTDVVRLIGSIPDTKSAIQMGGDEATIKFDFPRKADQLDDRDPDQRLQVYTLDLWQSFKRPIVLIGILLPERETKPAMKQTSMDMGEQKAEPAPKAEPSDLFDPDFPPTSGASVHNHLHLTLNGMPVEGELAPALRQALMAGEVRGLPEPNGEFIEG